MRNGELKFLLAVAGLLLSGCGSAGTPRLVPGRVFVGGAANQLRVLDGLDLSAQAPLPLPSPASGFLFNPQRDELYLWLAGDSDALVVADPATARVTATVPLGGRPTAVALDARLPRAYITLDGGNAAGQLVALDLAQRTVIGRRRVGRHPDAIATSWDGAQIAISNLGDATLTLLKTADLSPLATIALDSPATQLVGLPYGHRLFALCPNSNHVAAIDTARYGLLSYLTVGPAPAAMALKPDGGELYISNFAASSVSVIDTTAINVSTTMLAGKGPSAMAVTSDGNWLYVANSLSDSVAVINLAQRRMIAAVNVGAQPTTLLLGPGAEYVFVADARSNDIAVLRTDPQTQAAALVTLLPTLPHPALLGVALSGSGRR